MTSLPPPELLWIKTQDGSPTLWNNSLGEPYRSVKGAYSETLMVFVLPAIQAIQEKNLDQITIGEFGLGAGTNWVFASLAAKLLNKPLRYFAIEAYPEAFDEGLQKWSQDWSKICQLLSSSLGTPSEVEISELERPLIYPTLEAAALAGARADIWFHDPFAFSLNPEGYAPETLLKCKKLWNSHFSAFSYACNKVFQQNLLSIGVKKVRSVELPPNTLKRERLEFENLAD